MSVGWLFFSETLLEVEDEEVLLNLLRQSQETKGHAVIPARDGQIPFGLVREITPLAKVILASGYPEPNMNSELSIEGVNAIIRKPHSLQDMLLMIREVLEDK